MKRGYFQSFGLWQASAHRGEFAPEYFCAGYNQWVGLVTVLAMASLSTDLPDLVSFIVYHELKPLPFSDIEYSGDVKPEKCSCSINNAVAVVWHCGRNRVNLMRNARVSSVRMWVQQNQHGGWDI